MALDENTGIALYWTDPKKPIRVTIALQEDRLLVFDADKGGKEIALMYRYKIDTLSTYGIRFDGFAVENGKYVFRTLHFKFKRVSATERKGRG